MTQTFPTMPITSGQFNEILMHCKGKIYAIIETLEALMREMESSGVKRNNLETIATALYSHGLEEYGKLIILNEDVENSGTLIDLSPIRNIWFNHNAKINRALNELGSNCAILREAPFDERIFSSIFDTSDVVVDWDLRLKILNTDIDNQGNVKEISPIDLDKLKNAITQFKTAQYNH